MGGEKGHCDSDLILVLRFGLSGQLFQNVSNFLVDIGVRVVSGTCGFQWAEPDG